MFYLACPIGQVALPQKVRHLEVNVFIVHVLDFKFCFLWAKARYEAVEHSHIEQWESGSTCSPLNNLYPYQGPPVAIVRWQVNFILGN